MKALKTEQRNPRTRGLDAKSTLEILRILNREDQRVAPAVRRELPQIAQAVDAMVKACARVADSFTWAPAPADAWPCWMQRNVRRPTEHRRSMVQALIAGGRRRCAMRWRARKIPTSNGARELARAGATRGDVVVGIAASGTTPYVLGALASANRRGCVTIGVTSNRNSPLARAARIAIRPKRGQKRLTGSTRMKAGTSQKMVLNLLSTTTMVRLGRVYDNWMIYVALTNQKLLRRGERIS